MFYALIVAECIKYHTEQKTLQRNVLNVRRNDI